ncbi:LapA family protein [Thalassolituus sp. LLYu03]|uniref:LapA family protein n=1 Tax=Thalassolituus sp. LLYu03 TaxID=3421656 RepID=UPI003D2E23BB
MRKLKVGLSVGLFVLVALYALSFAANNAGSVELDFLLGGTLALPVSLWLGIALLVGLLIGISVGVLTSARRGIEVRKFRKEAADLRQRLNKLP